MHQKLSRQVRTTTNYPVLCKRYANRRSPEVGLRRGALRGGLSMGMTAEGRSLQPNIRLEFAGRLLEQLREEVGRRPDARGAAHVGVHD